MMTEKVQLNVIIKLASLGIIILIMCMADHVINLDQFTVIDREAKTLWIVKLLTPDRSNLKDK